MLKMESFSKEEKKRYKFKKHMKDHLFEYVLDFIGPILLTCIILYMCYNTKELNNTASIILFLLYYLC